MLNDDILVQTTSLQTIARVERVKCFMLQNYLKKSDGRRRFFCAYSICMVLYVCVVHMCTISLA